MAVFNNPETYINLFIGNGKLNIDYKRQAQVVVDSIEESAKLTELNPVSRKYINLLLDSDLTLLDLNEVLAKIPNTNNELIFNFVGSEWEDNDKFALFVATFYNNTKHEVVKFNLFKENDTEVLSFSKKTLFFKYKTLTVSKESNYIVPEDTLPHFNFKVLSNVDEVFNAVTSFNVSYNKENFTFNITNYYRILDNGLDPEYTVDISQIADNFYNISVITQVTPGIIQSALLEVKEDLLLRNCANLKVITDCGARYNSLVKKGYLKESGETDAGYTYQLTDKGLNYNRNSATRRSVRSGLAIDDVIINIVTGKLFKVMAFDFNSGVYNLMSEDCTPSKINILTDTVHYYAYPEEVKAFEELVV